MIHLQDQYTFIISLSKSKAVRCSMCIIITMEYLQQMTSWQKRKNVPGRVIQSHSKTDHTQKNTIHPIHFVWANLALTGKKFYKNILPKNTFTNKILCLLVTAFLINVTIYI